VLARFHKDPLVGNVLGLIALLIALGAGAYAAGLAPNSVKSKHIKDGQVKTRDLALEAVESSRLAPGSIQSELVPDDELVGGDIDESTLGTVPNASDAQDADLLDGKDSSEFQAAGSEGWTNLELNDNADPIGCHWTSFGGGFATPSYFRDRDGVVHLRGLAKAIDGTSFTCGTVPGFDETIVSVSGLPDGYRPELRSLFTISSNNLPGRVDIFANGTIAASPGYPTYANMKQWVSLDGISYRCGPSGSNGCP
jgi:hypothetical protein